MPYRLATQSDNEEWNGFGKEKVPSVSSASASWAVRSRANSRGRRLASHRLRHCAAARRAMARAGVEIAGDAGEVARKAKTIITSLPSPKALAATVEMIVKAKAPRRVIVVGLDLHARRQDRRRSQAAQGRARHARLPDAQRGAQAKVKDLGDTLARTCVRTKATFAGFARRRITSAPSAMAAA